MYLLCWTGNWLKSETVEFSVSRLRALTNDVKTRSKHENKSIEFKVPLATYEAEHVVPSNIITCVCDIS